MNALASSLKKLLRVSLQICVAVLLYFIFMWLQMFFNRLPYNLSLSGPLLLLITIVWLKKIWLKKAYRTAVIVRYALRTLVLSIAGILFFKGLTLLAMFFNADNNLPHFAGMMRQTIIHPLKHLPAMMNIYISAAMEEVLCRFLILALLTANGMNRYLAILISAIVFSVCHGQYNYYALVYITFIGIALGMLYVLFRNPGMAIGMHFTINYFVYCSQDYNPHTYYLPTSLAAVWRDNSLTTYYCVIVFAAWVYTQYIRPRWRKQQMGA